MKKAPKIKFKDYFFKKPGKNSVTKKHAVVSKFCPFNNKLQRKRTLACYLDLIDDGDAVIDESISKSLLKKIAPLALSAHMFLSSPASAGKELENASKPLTIEEVSTFPRINTFVSRVIFSEGANVNPFERYLIASVMKNRINNKAFGGGKLHDMESVAKQPKAFSCVNDSSNSNWKKSATTDKLTAKEQRVMVQCILLSRGTFTAYDDIVFYHDKSITKPSSWDKFYKTELVIETPKFMFYRIVSK